MAAPIQWEYRILSLGTFWSDPKDDQMESALDELGLEGWEAVGLISQYGTNRVRVLFKRPLGEDNPRRRWTWPG